MSLVRYRNEVSPWNALRELETHFNRMFNDENGTTVPKDWIPAVDVSESDEAYIVDWDIPGMKREDITLEVFENTLMVRGERKAEHEDEDKKRGYHRVERSYGSFQRSIRIPGGFNPDEVTANFNDGVLRVTLPKTDEARPRQIPVNN